MPNENRPVTMCVCHNKTFASLKEANVKSLEDAMERFGCGSNCGTCVPYIRAMLKTGEVRFAIIPTDLIL